MASLFRPTYTKADPITGGRVSRKVRKWYGKYRDASGRIRCTPLSPIGSEVSKVDAPSPVDFAVPRQLSLGTHRVLPVRREAIRCESTVS